MRLKHVLTLALASQTVARNLSEALASQNSSLSALNGMVLSSPDILSAFNNASNITVLAPNNAAIRRFIDESPSGSISRYGPGALAALLRYHILNGTYYASDLSSGNNHLFIPTYLANSTYTNVTGGQMVEATNVNGKINFNSGLEHNSTVVTPNTNFTGGTLHIIDRVLTLPVNDTRALVAAGLTADAGALDASDQAEKLSSQTDVTIFAPTNDAFDAVGNIVGSLTSQQLSKVMLYHVIRGKVAYGPELKNGSFRTSADENVTITVLNGDIFINSAKVTRRDIIVNNGVIHIIDNVLNPNNTTATPNATATSGSPGFTGGTDKSGVPFTSMPTGTHSTSSGPGVPVKTGAVGAAALFGGAAVLVNL